MPWNNQGGGPWGGGSGSSGGGGAGGGGPWGGKRPGGGGGGAPIPPDIEDLMRRSQDRIQRLLPGGAGSARGLLIAALAVVVIWLLTGFYRVNADEQGVVLTFGKWNQVTSEPGLHYWFPAPIGEVLTPQVTAVNRTDIGFRGASDVPGTRGGGPVADVPRESLMLTGDQNIADIDFTVQWRVGNAGEFLFNIRQPEATVRSVAESAMREVVGRTDLTRLITEGRQEVEQSTRVLLQQVLDEYGTGVLVQRVQLQDAAPPPQVIDSFNEVQRARQDKERLSNQAEAYENRIVPTARGEAASIEQQAEAYKERVIKEAEGEAIRFLDIYESYKDAREVTRRRLYLEALSDVLTNSNKIIIDQEGDNTQGVVPFLPLNELARPRNTETEPTGAQQ